MPRKTWKAPADNPYGELSRDEDKCNADDSAVSDNNKTAQETNTSNKAKKKDKAKKKKKRSNLKERWKKKYSQPFVRSLPSHILLASAKVLPTASNTNVDSTSNHASNGTDRDTTRSRPQSNPSSTLTLETIDPRIQGDLFAVRRRAFDESKDGKARTLETAPSSVWDGVLPIEKEMIMCCEMSGIQLDDDNPTTSPSSSSTAKPSSIGKGNTKNGRKSTSSKLSAIDYLFNSTMRDNALLYPHGGVLSIDKEVRFAAILTSRGHNASTKNIAVTILERTLEQYLWEQQEKKLASSQPVDTAAGKPSKSGDNNESQATKPVAVSPETKTRSSRFTRVQQSAERNGNSKQPNGSSECIGPPNSIPTQIENAKETKGRLQSFFAAGGLKVLSQWLADASSTEVLSFHKSNNSQNKTKKSNAKGEETTSPILRASSSRPIVLSILRFLEHIPFDKTCVTDSKINKQVQKLGKKVDSIIQEHENGGEALEEDLDNWSVDKSISPSDALRQIAEAVSAVKKSWKQKAKDDAGRLFADPFQVLRATMKSRVDEYNKYKAGTIEKPDWYNPRLDTSTSAAATTSSLSTTTTATGRGVKNWRWDSATGLESEAQRKKRKTLEMAAKERMAEREKFQQQLAAIQKKRQEQLHLLHEKLQKRMAPKKISTSSAALPSSGTTVRVSWKDGEKSGRKRNRKELEEVFLFDKETPSAFMTKFKGR